MGHSLIVNCPAVGEYMYWSNPAEENVEAKDVAGRLSMFTMIIVTTSFGFAETHDETFWRYELRVPPFWIAQEVWQT